MIGTSTYAVNAVMQVFIGSQLYHIQLQGKSSSYVDDIFFVVEMLIGCGVSALMAYYANKMIKSKLIEFEKQQELDKVLD